MEPGPTERHESDTSAATTPVDGSAGTAGATGGAGATNAAADAVPPRPRTRRGWMSDSPLDGGSGWPTSAYAIIPRPANLGSVNGSANAAAPHQGTATPDCTRQGPAAQSTGAGETTRPGEASSADETRQPARVKVPQQKSGRRSRDTANREAPGQAGASQAGSSQGVAPRRATPSTEPRGVALTPPAVDPREARDDPAGTSHRGLAIAGALIFVLAVALAVFFAVRSASTDADKTGSASACAQSSEGRVASFVARPIDVGADGGITTV
jgi:hypothetical protein